MLLDLGPKKRKLLLTAPPPTPETGWRPPSEWPNLSAATLIGFDLERKELDFEAGPGWARGAAHTIGVSIAATDRRGNRGKWYFPFAHEVEPQYNLEKQHVIGFLKYWLENTPHVPKIGANLYYDVGSLTDDGIEVKGQLYDVQFAEALLHSDGEVNLEHLGRKYLQRGKQIDQVALWVKTYYGKTANPRENLWRVSPRLAGPYAEDDADMPIDILAKQWPLMASENLLDLFHLECDLISVFVKMRQQGVKVNVAAATKLYDDLAQDIVTLHERIKYETGYSIDSVNSGDQLARVYNSLGIPFGKTPTGKPSFKKEWLLAQTDPFSDLVLKIRELEKIRNTFIKGYIIDKNVNGILYCQFNQLRSTDDAGGQRGAITGRLSSSDPNLQNIPIRGNDFSVREGIAKEIRNCFISHYPNGKIRKGDYSQIEYVYLAHFAVDKGDGSADALRQSYWDDPKTDYHKKTFERLAPLMGWDVTDEKQAKELRRPVKNINFGLLYGMGKAKLMRALMQYFHHSAGKEMCELLFENYHKANPYVKPTMEAAAREARIFGYVSTVLGRRVRFTLWEPNTMDFSAPRAVPLPYEKALRAYGSNIRLSGLHAAINYRLQGSAADQLKKGMLECYRAGIFDYIGYPLLQVHDELVFNKPEGAPYYEEAFAEGKRLLETAIPLRVPVRFDYSDGPSWGEAEKG